MYPIEKNLPNERMKPIAIGAIAAMAFFWVYQIDVFPGLHGDEAWFGIEACLANKSGSYSWHGMNHYTGSLEQNLVSVAFAHFGSDTSSLRLVGILANMAALCILYCALSGIPGYKGRALCFFLFLCQSSLWMIYPRIAWEVNAFTLLFMSLLLWSSVRIWNSSPGFWTACLFLLACLLGGYNHILFACIPLSILSATILRGFRNRYFHLDQLLLSAAALLNSSVLFGLMFFRKGAFFDANIRWIGPLLIAMVLLESRSITRIGQKKVPVDFPAPAFACRMTNIVAAIFVFAFLRNHAAAVYDVLSNDRILSHIYSFSPHPSAVFVFRLAAAATLAATAVLIYRDWRSGSPGFAPFVISYAGLLSLFTTAHSPRYYLSFTIILFLYLSLKIASRSHFRYLTNALSALSVTLFAQLYLVYSNKDRTFIPREVSFGSIREPSSHFLPLSPVVNYLRENRIQEVETQFHSYFIKTPIRFIELTQPWQQNPGTKIHVEYGKTADNGGFVIADNQAGKIAGLRTQPQEDDFQEKQGGHLPVIPARSEKTSHSKKLP